VADQEVRDLLQRSAISFVGTVEHLGAATMSDVPVDDHTAVIHVESVLHAPPAFLGLAGSSLTLQLLPEEPVPAVGDRIVSFANALAFSESLALTEIGRLPEASILPHVGLAAGDGSESSFADLQSGLEADRIHDHAASADAVVVGRVAGLAKAGASTLSEHDPDWWVATINVDHVEQGKVSVGPIQVLYANSIDVTWRNSPKPRAGQSGVWILHTPDAELQSLAPYYLRDAEDYQPAHALDSIRMGSGQP
jgi:hypothetical protein